MAVSEIEHLSIFIDANQQNKQLSIKRWDGLLILQLLWCLNINTHNAMLRHTQQNDTQQNEMYQRAGKAKGGSITVQLTSRLTCLGQSVLQMKTKIVSCHTADSKPVKQEVNSTVILPSLVFPVEGDLAPSSHRSIVIEIIMAGKPSWENDLSIVPMSSTNSQFFKLTHCLIPPPIVQFI